MGAHSSLGASVMPRLIHCPGSAQLSEGVDTGTTDSAEKGTAVHEINEIGVPYGLDGYDFIGKTMSNGYQVTQEMADSAQVWISWVRHRFSQAHLMLEERVDLSRLYAGMFGTADLLAYDEQRNWLDVADYKNGRYTVEVDSPQLAYYAIGAVFKILDRRKAFGDTRPLPGCTVHIVQPNGSHIDGPIRSRDYTMGELNGWANTFYRVAVDAMSDNPTFKAGDHCRFCPARSFCSTRILHTLNLLMPWPPLKRLSDEQIAAILLESDAISAHLKAVQEHARQLALGGRNIPQHKLVKPNKHYVCKDENGFIHEVEELGIDPAAMYKKPELLSKSAAEKKLGEHKDLTKKYFEKPDGELQLVKMTDARPAESVGRVPAGTFEPVGAFK